jgi:hypothetical protein
VGIDSSSSSLFCKVLLYRLWFGFARSSAAAAAAAAALGIDSSFSLCCKSWLQRICPAPFAAAMEITSYSSLFYKVGLRRLWIDFRTSSAASAAMESDYYSTSPLVTPFASPHGPFFV